MDIHALTMRASRTATPDAAWAAAALLMPLVALWLTRRTLGEN